MSCTAANPDVPAAGTGAAHVTDDEPRICRVGNHYHHGIGEVCAEHLTWLRASIRRLPQLAGRLTDILVPGSAPSGDKVSSSHTGSPVPGNLGAYSLVGPGAGDVWLDTRAMVPVVRRWSATETVTVLEIEHCPYPADSEHDHVRASRAAWLASWPDGKPVYRRRQMRVWHSQIVTNGRGTRCRCGDVHGAGRPVMRRDEDQHGVIPPAEWCDIWVTRFRRELGRPAGDRTAVVSPVDPDPRKRLARAALGLRPHIDVPARLARGPYQAMPALVAYLQAVLADRDRAARTAVGAAVLGLRPGYAGEAPPLRHDPVSAAWSVRFDLVQRAASIETDTAWLADNLPLAAEYLPDIGDFAAELAALLREMEHLLGDTVDDQWLGRCPIPLLDADGNPTDRYCGMGMWHDPHKTGWRIQCARCLTTWPERDWLQLAARIHWTWPVDPRRRYTEAERRESEANLERMPRCRTCGQTMHVEWLETTGTRDRTRRWRPGRLTCPASCAIETTATT